MPEDGVVIRPQKGSLEPTVRPLDSYMVEVAHSLEQAARDAIAAAFGRRR